VGFITANPMERVGQLKRAKKTVNKKHLNEEQGTMPLDTQAGEANWNKIRESVIPFLRRELGGSPRGVFTRYPENFLGLLEVMYHTGLRVSDAAHFEPDDIETDSLGRVSYTTLQIKTKDPVTCYFLPDQLWLVEKLRKLPRMDPEGRYVFLTSHRRWKYYIANNVNYLLAELSKAIGIPGIRCHRFRDSFAVNQLLEGASLEELQKMLGHKLFATTEKYYAPWVPSRQDKMYDDRLRRRMEATSKNIIPIDQRRTGT